MPTKIQTAQQRVDKLTAEREALVVRKAAAVGQVRTLEADSPGLHAIAIRQGTPEAKQRAADQSAKLSALRDELSGFDIALTAVDDEIAAAVEVLTEARQEENDRQIAALRAEAASITDEIDAACEQIRDALDRLSVINDRAPRQVSAPNGFDWREQVFTKSPTEALDGVLYELAIKIAGRKRDAIVPPVGAPIYITKAASMRAAMGLQSQNEVNHA